MNDQLNLADIAALKLAKGGVECEHGTESGKHYERLCELGYVKESTLTADGIAWRLTGKGAEIAYSEDGIDGGIHGNRPISWQIDRLIAVAEEQGRKIMLIRAAKPFVESLAAELSPELKYHADLNDGLLYRSIRIETDPAALTGWVVYDANGLAVRE